MTTDDEPTAESLTDAPHKIAGHVNATDEWLRNFVAIRAEDFTPPSDEKVVEWITAILEHLEQTPNPATRRALDYAGCRRDYDRTVRKLRQALGDRLVKQHLAARRDAEPATDDRDTPASG